MTTATTTHATGGGEWTLQGDARLANAWNWGLNNRDAHRAAQSFTPDVLSEDNAKTRFAHSILNCRCREN
eukprot:gene6197-262_t